LTLSRNVEPKEINDSASTDVCLWIGSCV